MAEKCEINLYKCPDEAYKPGSTVSGVVKYVLNQDKVFKRILVSLKGTGECVISEGRMRYFGKDTYVDIDHVILDNTNNTKCMPTAAGNHEIPFSFTIPQNVPPTYKFIGGDVLCEIAYYIRIKFERFESLKRDKRFRTAILVDSTITPTLYTCPVTYQCAKIPTQPFWRSNNNDAVKISGTIDNSVTTPNGRVNIGYNLDNKTKYDILGVTITLTEEILFRVDGTTATSKSKLKEIRATPLRAGDVQTMKLVMDIPEKASTIQHSRLVTRSYFVNIEADLPFPHKKAVLKLPIEIMHELKEESNVEFDAPPSYSQAMENVKKDSIL